jgi:LysM repeat protein
MISGEIHPMKAKRLFYLLLLNILVSACTTYVVLTLWSRSHPPVSVGVEPVVSSPGTPVVSARLTPVTPQVTAVVITVTHPISQTVVSEPRPGVITYTVQAGDILGEIAIKFGVSLNDLIALNHLNDPNVVPRGMILLIPPQAGPPTSTPTLLPPTPTPTATPGPSSTPTTSEPTQEPQVVIVGILGPGDLATERVQLKLNGGGDISLRGWQLKDEDGNTFTFPELTLYGGGQVDVYTKTGQSTVNFLYWNLEAPVWRSGETATLVDAQGDVRATYTVL